MHIIWEALNCLPSVMFECQVSHLSMTCIFKPAWLLIAFQQQVADITIHMSKNDGLENYLKKKKKNFFFFFFLDFHIREVLPHSRECGSRAAFPEGSRMIREGSHVWLHHPHPSVILVDTSLKFHAVSSWPPKWPWGQGHELRNFMLKFLVKVFKSLYLLMHWMDLVNTLPGLKFYVAPSSLISCLHDGALAPLLFAPLQGKAL